MINLSNDDLTGKAVLYSIANLVMEDLECHLHLDSGLSVSAYAFSMWSLCIKQLLVNPSERCVCLFYHISLNMIRSKYVKITLLTTSRKKCIFKDFIYGGVKL